MDPQETDSTLNRQKLDALLTRFAGFVFALIFSNGIRRAWDVINDIANSQFHAPRAQEFVLAFVFVTLSVLWYLQFVSLLHDPDFVTRLCSLASTLITTFVVFPLAALGLFALTETYGHLKRFIVVLGALSLLNIISWDFGVPPDPLAAPSDLDNIGWFWTLIENFRLIALTACLVILYEWEPAHRWMPITIGILYLTTVLPDLVRLRHLYSLRRSATL